MAATNIAKNNFRFFLPITEIKKSRDKSGKEVMILGGIASTKSRDTDGERLHPDGFDLSYFRHRGIINWNHSRLPEDVIGEPELAEIRPEGLYIRTKLYANSKRAQEVYNLAETLRRNKSKRALGYSIEGKATERDENDESEVTQAFVTNAALTISPKNSDSFVNIIKGNFHGWGDDEAPPPLESEIDFEESNGGQQHIIDIVRPDGMRVIVDKEYKIRVEKAANTVTDSSLIPEHVDGEEKVLTGPTEIQRKKAGLVKGLTRNEVLNHIFSRNSVISTYQQANDLYQTLKDFTMKKSTVISEDLLDKALDKLDLRKGHKREEPEEEEHEGRHHKRRMEKSENEGEDEYEDEDGMEKGHDEEDEEEDEEDEEELEHKPRHKKSIRKAVSAPKKTRSSRQNISDPADSEEVADEYEENGKPLAKRKGFKEPEVKLKKSIRKSITDDPDDAPISKYEATELVKALGIITKSTRDLVKGLHVRIDDLEDQLSEFQEAPAAPRKSIRKSVDRRFNDGMRGEDMLEKGVGAEEGGAKVFSLTRNRRVILDAMDAMAFDKGQYNSVMGNAMTRFEASGRIDDRTIIKAVEDNLGGKLVK